jgi:hypothetical protein
MALSRQEAGRRLFAHSIARGKQPLLAGLPDGKHKAEVSHLIAIEIETPPSREEVPRAVRPQATENRIEPTRNKPR